MRRESKRTGGVEYEKKGRWIVEKTRAIAKIRLPYPNKKLYNNASKYIRKNNQMPFKKAQTKPKNKAASTIKKPNKEKAFILCTIIGQRINATHTTTPTSK